MSENSPEKNLWQRAPANADKGDWYSYSPVDERVPENPERPEQGSSQGSAGFHWQIEGYTHAEHTAIFRQAVEAGEVEGRILRLLAEGAPSLEELVGGPTKEDQAVPADLARKPKAEIPLPTPGKIVFIG